jgi:hypothetical protein
MLLPTEDTPLQRFLKEENKLHRLGFVALAEQGEQLIGILDEDKDV